MKIGKLQSLIKGLTSISLDENSLPEEERIRLIITVLKEKYKDLELRRILKSYLFSMKKIIFNSSMVIEHCGELSSSSMDSIRLHFENLLSRKLNVSTVINPGLIAGLRISVADTVIEHSISSTLNSYKNSLKSVS